MNIFTTLHPNQRRSLLVLFTAGLLFWAGLSALLPTLPLYIADAGGDSRAVGIVMGSFAIGLLVSRPWLAKLADTRGRKLVLLIGISTVAIAPLGYLVTTDLPLLFGIRAFHGLSIAAFALAYSALVVDISPPQYRGELIGYMSLVNPVGLALGPAIGGFLQEWAGYTPMFLVSAGLGTIGLLCTAQVREPKSTLEAIANSEQTEPDRFWSLLLTSRVRIPALVLLLIGFDFGMLSTFVPLYIQEAGVQLNVGLFYTAAAIASFLARLMVGRASDRFGRGPFISISLVFYALAMALLWQARSAPMFLLAGVMEGFGAGTLIPMIAALMADRSLPNERGRMFGLCMVGFDIGIAIAGPLLGIVADSIGYRTSFGICALLACSALAIFVTLSSKDVRHSLRFAVGRGRDIYAIAPTLLSTQD